MQIKIYYDDTDAGGVVYHSNYLKYFERGRTEYMLKRGIDPAQMAKSGLIFVIVHAELSFLAPAKYGETIEVATFIENVSHASVTFNYRILSSDLSAPMSIGTQTGKSKTLVTGKTKVALVNQEEGKLKPQRFSDDFIRKIKMPFT
ncbi:MAG: thioesterase family protein [Planctomycetota bacterium]|nr:thioesterase family protein [Planctomycetota bacterium]MDI6787018.1 thioesterase family protein [Planctomycetota bacterium]